MSADPPAPRARPAVWALPLATGLVLRLAAGFATPATAQGLRGFDFYGRMADNLLEGRGLVWLFYEGLGWKHANRAPLYPLLVAGVRAFAGHPARAALIVTQSLLGMLAILATALLARRWGGTRAAVLALWMGALWPYSVLADTGLIEHVLYAPLVVLATWGTLRASDAQPPSTQATRPDRSTRGALAAFAAGLLCGFATLARLTFAVTLPVLGLWTLLRRGLRPALLVAAGTALVLAPWVIRNHGAVGAWTLGTDGGRALWVGNSAITYERYPAESIDEGERELFRKMDPALATELRALGRDEMAQDARFRELALAAIAEDPAAAALRGLRRAGALWSLVYNPGPTAPAKLAIFAASFALLLAAACAGAATEPRLRADLPVVLGVALSFTLVAATFWGQPRYLAPLHGLGIAAAAAWVARRPAAGLRA